MSKFTKGIFYSILLTAGSIPAVSADEVFHETVNQSLPFWSVIPFVVMLLAVAFVPLINSLWWAKNTKWVSLGCALFFLIPFSYAYGISEGIYRLLESSLLDFIPFIVLLYGLYATAGGIMIHGKLAGTPIINSLILFVGTVMASWIGTTGAAMLFIRPLIRVNEWRKEKAHVMVFLIFLVANMGGCLTPLGDPPLFMGFQRGVPFTWTFHLFPILMLNLILLFIAFYFIDRHYFKNELVAGRQPSDMQLHDNSPLVKIYGKKNFFYILLIIVGVMANNFLPEAIPFFANGAGIPIFEEIVFPYSTLVEIILILSKAAIAMKPDYDVELIKPYIAKLDMVLPMSVFPGFSGQSYIQGTEAKVARIVEMAREAGVSPLIEVDGGLRANDPTRAVCAAGCDVLVAGSGVFGASDRAAAIAEMKAVAAEAQKNGFVAPWTNDVQA